MRIRGLLVCAMLLSLAQRQPVSAAEEQGWTPLFDGKTTEGWRNPYTYGTAWVENGVINLQANKKFFLVTEKKYGDFIFEGEVLLPKGPANSGFMFRCHADPNKVFGYQAEVDSTDRGWSGGLYDEGRRKWLVPMEGDKAAGLEFAKRNKGNFKRYDWNTYRIQCVGDHIQIWLNGKQTVDFHDPLDKEGYIGIQHHGEKGQIYQFRNLRIMELKPGSKSS